MGCMQGPDVCMGCMHGPGMSMGDMQGDGDQVKDNPLILGKDAHEEEASLVRKLTK